MQSAPPAIRRSISFPYTFGARFVIHHQAKGGWERVNELLRSPPHSSEQILHPSKALDDRDPPVRVSLPAPPLKGLERLAQGTLGELDTWSVLEVGVAEEEARRGAAGWGGDRYSLYDQGRRRPKLLIWLTVWDSEYEAAEFDHIFNKVWRARFPSDPVALPWRAGRRVEVRDAGRHGHLVRERRGKRVLVLQGVRYRQVEPLRNAIWQAVDGGSRHAGAPDAQSSHVSR